ncbi:MAG: PRC-barrel domain-containing protein [Pseudomonadaceae bacterium]|nr:PRC-barrel domain-containing protein [Pseudomonadaceae bacterium]
MFNRMSMQVAVITVVLAGSLLPEVFVPSAWAAASGTVKATSWVGRVVVTANGELLGRVEDLAVDVEQQRVKFVVVSIGSFLIDENLIAVDPKALGESDDGRYLVVYADNLDRARRFGADTWPDQADVLPSASRQPPPEDIAAVDQNSAPVGSGPQATISDGRRTATLNAGERSASIEQIGVQPQVASSDVVQPKKYTRGSTDAPLLADSEFERLDENNDGYLSRGEIGVRLNKGIRYQDYDLDDNDGIDPFEFQLLKNRS